jgi:mRNA-degrading endonuclease RelE of RelBE toxin-antitoxin system
MKYSVQYSDNFARELKRLLKKHRSLKDDLLKLVETLEENPETGTSLGNNCFKVRVAISSKGKGKSGGARVITHVYVKGKIVYLLSIFDKADQESITDKEIAILLKDLD